MRHRWNSTRRIWRVVRLKRVYFLIEEWNILAQSWSIRERNWRTMLEPCRAPFVRLFHGPLSRITAQVCAGLSFMGTLAEYDASVWPRRALVCIWRTNRVNYWYLEGVSHGVTRWRSRCETTCTPFSSHFHPSLSLSSRFLSFPRLA